MSTYIIYKNNVFSESAFNDPKYFYSEALTIGDKLELYNMIKYLPSSQIKAVYI
jgi:hypothetical protein